MRDGRFNGIFKTQGHKTLQLEKEKARKGGTTLEKEEEDGVERRIKT